MVIGKIKPSATVVAQFAAGVEVEAIQHDGKLFLPVLSLGDFGKSEDTTTSDAPAPPKKKAAPAPAEDAPVKSYSKEELMDMDSKELVKILKNDFDVNPDDFDGKNTNKKLRDLILKAQEGSVESKDDADEDAEEEKKPAKKSSKKAAPAENEDDDEDDLLTKVSDELEAFDDGSKNKKKVLSALCELADDADEDAVSAALEDFENDGEATIDSAAEAIVAILTGKKSAKKETEKGKAAPKKKKEELVEIDDLEVGDRVSVYWSDQEEWYDGEVSTIKKGKVTVDYDDGTADVLDEEIHTKIKKLAE